jgi:integrase
MPARQDGTVVKRGERNYQARWRDEHGRQHGRGGFATRTEAREWLRDQLDEVHALRRGDAIPVSHRPTTVAALLDAFEERHAQNVDPATLRTDRSSLKHARRGFGTRHPDSLNRLELEDWRATLAEGSRHRSFRTFRQALVWGHSRGLITRDASVGIKNPKRRRHERREVCPFESWDEVFALGDELHPRFRVIPILAVGCGLRPEELFGLHRTDVDRQANVLGVERRYTGGKLKPGGKTPGSVRSIPLRKIVLDALDTMPTRIDTPILVPAARGGYIDIERFRHREWTPALRGAGLDHRRIYDCRHTFATWAIEDGVPLWHLAVVMGTSVVQIEDTYARWLKRTDDQLRATFDAYDARASSSATS